MLSESSGYELLIPHPTLFIEKLLEWQIEGSDNWESFLAMSKQELAALAQSNGVEIIGRGSEHIVLTHPTRPDLVLALRLKRSMNFEESRILFHTHAVLSTLFPDNFPRFIATLGGSILPLKTGSIRQRIPFDPNQRYQENIYYFAEIFNIEITC